MNNKIFGEVTFNMGWESKIKINIWDSEYQVTVSAASYYEKDQINEEQENAYLRFLRDKESIIHKIEGALLAQNKNAKEKYKPTLLKIARDGAIALVFDDNDDPEDGIVACIDSEIELISVDEYF